MSDIRIGRATLKKLFREFIEEMDITFSDEKNLQLFDFILEDILTKQQLILTKKFKTIRNLFYDMFGLAIKYDPSYNTSRLILNVFLAKIEKSFGIKAKMSIINQLNGSLPLYFKNLFLQKHSEFYGIPLKEVINRFNSVFNDILIIPSEYQVKAAIQEYIKKEHKLKIIKFSNLSDHFEGNSITILILDSNFILNSWNDDKSKFFSYLHENNSKLKVLTSIRIFDELTFHFDLLDKDFIYFIKSIYLCKVPNKEIQNVKNELLKIKRFNSIIQKHEYISLLNDLSLIVLASKLKENNKFVLTQDRDLLKFLNHFNIRIDTKFPIII
ncbi:MAG: hypothetical protein ACTSWR_01975 [Candidatus Helarchaeota archaeon]